MRTLTNPLKHMNGIENFRLLEKYTMYPATLCSFWKTTAATHFARLTCNHSYGYAFRSIEQIDSLTDFIKYTPLSAFLCNMRASMY